MKRYYNLRTHHISPPQSTLSRHEKSVVRASLTRYERGSWLELHSALLVELSLLVCDCDRCRNGLDYDEEKWREIIHKMITKARGDIKIKQLKCASPSNSINFKARRHTTWRRLTTHSGHWASSSPVSSFVCAVAVVVEVEWARQMNLEQN